MTDDITMLDTIDDYNQLLGVKTLHPLVSMTDFSKIPRIKHRRLHYNFYCIYYKELLCGTIQYGRSKYDYQEGTLLFIAPGQTAGVSDGGTTENPRGYALMFHPDLLYGTPLARRIKDYSFFSYDSNEALHMSEREKEIILNCFKEIGAELEHAIDKHTKQIISSTIETMLNYSTRFYDRQFITREVPNRSVVRRFEETLREWFESGEARRSGLPTVQMCASKACLSSNYFGDLIKKELGTTAQEYIQQYVTDRAKWLMAESELNVSEIAYELGFKYPHHLTRMFKKVTGITPGTYRLKSR